MSKYCFKKNTTFLNFSNTVLQQVSLNLSWSTGSLNRLLMVNVLKRDTCKQHLKPVWLTFVLKPQEGAVTGQEVSGLLQASQLQTVGLLQLHGETHEETQHTSETALTQQEVRQQELLCTCSVHENVCLVASLQVFPILFLIVNFFSWILLLFRPDLLKSEVILPKLDSSMTQVTINSKGSTSPGRSRRGKPRYRKAGKGSTGDLAQLKATLSSSLAMVNSTMSVPSSKQRLDPSAAIRGLQHDLLLKKMYSSSPDLISTTVEAEGRRKGLVSPGLDRVGSLSASTGLVDGRRTPGTGEGPNADVGTEDLAEIPPRSDTPSEDAASLPFSSSPDSPCGRGAAVGRASMLGNSRISHEGEEKEETVITRSPRSQRLTPAALLYRAAVTRSQVRPKCVKFWPKIVKWCWLFLLLLVEQSFNFL